jgi:hypothetical protein
LLLRWLARAAAAIGSLFARRPGERQASAAVRRPKPLDIPVCSTLCDGLRGRAPPLLAVSLR